MIGGIVIFFILLLIVCVRILKNKKEKYPKGYKVIFKYNEFEATLIVDDLIQISENDFILEDKKINKNSLAKMCAMSMEAYNHVAKTIGPTQSRSSKKLINCIFVFLTEEKYYKVMKDVYKTKIPSVGFSEKLKYEFYCKSGPYICYMNTKYMSDVCNSGGLAVHEYAHCYSHFISNDWDIHHELWKFKSPNGKTLQYAAVDRIKTKLELDKKLQS